MGIPSQECDDELVRLGASSFQSGNFVCFYFYFLQDLAAEMLFNKYLTIVFIWCIDSSVYCVNNVSSVNRINSARREIEFIARCFLHLWWSFFLQEPDSRDAVEQNCNRLTIFLHHNNSKSSGTQSSKVTCVDYCLFVCLLSKENNHRLFFVFWNL